MDFVDRVLASGVIDEEWQAYVDAKRTAELDAVITTKPSSLKKLRHPACMPSPTMPSRLPAPP